MSYCIKIKPKQLWQPLTTLAAVARPPLATLAAVGRPPLVTLPVLLATPAAVASGPAVAIVMFVLWLLNTVRAAGCAQDNWCLKVCEALKSAGD